ncbi:hypothetical protein J4434_08465 [Candidatus Woesearchaeota archaeon]|nr:hypothetical protein [Candidatus Woesearchaeota archaeon]
MIEEKYMKQTFLVIIVVIAIVFFIGILLGKHIESKEQEEIARFIKNLELNTESFLVEQELLGASEDCSLSEERINSLSSELYNLGIMLSEPTSESNLGKDNYKLLKKKFHLMQIRTYLLYNQFKKNCKSDEHVILFYYGKNNPDSKEQGKILDEIGKIYPVNVFALEFNYTKELTFLEDYYGISEPPAIVIDYDDVNKGLASYEKIANTVS